MSYWHCTNCHHEWEGSKESNVCDWCGCSGYILEESTPFERMMEDWFDPKSDLRGMILGIKKH